MKKINEILKKCDIKPIKYQKNGHTLIVYTKEKKYVIKKSNSEVYEYLLNRNFDYYPDTILVDDYAISEYLQEPNIPEEQKILDLINLVSLLHLKTTYYEKININDIKNIYEDIKNNINHLINYYNMLMDNIETKEFMSPKEYALARNITLFLKTLNICNEDLDKWYKNSKEITNHRVVLLHNNLKLEHFIDNNFISFENASLGLPIFDLYKLYKETYNFDWLPLFKKYQENYPLKEEEIVLFLILIMLPNKIEFSGTEYLDTYLVTKEVSYIKSSASLASKIKDEYITKI